MTTHQAEGTAFVTPEIMATLSDTVIGVQQALSKVMADVGAVGKDSQNQQQGFRFRGIDAVVNAVSPAFRRHGIIAVPRVLNVDRETVTTNRGGTMAVVHLLVEYRFYGPAGDSVSAVVAAESFDSGDKATAKAMSVAYRTALLQVLCLPTDETDPDQHTFERADVGAPVDERDAAKRILNKAKTDLLAHTDGDAPSAAAIFEQILDTLTIGSVDAVVTIDEADTVRSAVDEFIGS